MKPWRCPNCGADARVPGACECPTSEDPAREVFSRADFFELAPREGTGLHADRPRCAALGCGRAQHVGSAFCGERGCSREDERRDAAYEARQDERNEPDPEADEP